MNAIRSRRAKSALAGAEPLPPRRKWRAILLATLLLVPAYWSLLAGQVSSVLDRSDGPPPGPFLAFGVSLIPFVFIVLAFMSEHPRAPGAVIRAMVLALVIGIPVAALAQDAVTPFVAGVGAGGVAALRADAGEETKARALAVLLAAAYVFFLVRVATGVALLAAPILPLTAIGVADHLSQRRQERQAEGGA